MFFEIYVPSGDDLAECTCIELTSESEWNPKTVPMTRDRPCGDEDDTYVQLAKEIKRENRRRRNVPFQGESDIVLCIVSRSFVGHDFYERLVSTIKVDYKPRRKAAKSLPHRSRQVV